MEVGIANVILECRYGGEKVKCNTEVSVRRQKCQMQRKSIDTVAKI